jgi:glyoxylase-like metal-dependent hydrolase (beta-lactamase superfamily II)
MDNTKIQKLIADWCKAERAAVATHLHDDHFVASRVFKGGRRWAIVRVDAEAGRVVANPYAYTNRRFAVFHMSMRAPSQATLLLTDSPSYPHGVYTPKV